MININVLKGFEPRFKNFEPEDPSPKNCAGITIPTVDNSSVDCLEFHSTNCVKTAINYPYFSVAENETLTSVLTKIVNKVKTIADKFRTTIDYSKLVIYANDADAGAAGLGSGMPYKDANGFVRVKI
jgi:hypothetical protein